MIVYTLTIISPTIYIWPTTHGKLGTVRLPAAAMYGAGEHADGWNGGIGPIDEQVPTTTLISC